MKKSARGLLVLPLFHLFGFMTNAPGKQAIGKGTIKGLCKDAANNAAEVTPVSCSKIDLQGLPRRVHLFLLSLSVKQFGCYLQVGAFVIRRYLSEK